MVTSVSAVSLDDLKIPSNYLEESDGYYTDILDEDTHIYIGELALNDKLFENSPDGTYGVSKLDDNIYIYLDTLLVSSGVQEIVELDEGKYVVSFYNDNVVADVDNNDDVKMMDGYHQELKKFNKDNGLTPIEF